MTVISTVISKHCVAHATDSLITFHARQPEYEVSDETSPKLVCVRRWAGIMSYFGLAAHGSWSTLGFLKAESGKASNFTTPEEFAHHIASGLNSMLKTRKFQTEMDKGIGVHFTAYEDVDGYRIPEPFHITNFDGTGYDRLLPGGVRATRETYATSPGRDGSDRDSHGEPRYRLAVKSLLDTGFVYMYNNGDPRLFNAAANAIGTMLTEASSRGALEPPTSTDAHRQLVGLPVKLVSSIQLQFFRREHRVVGGKPHNLSVTPTGLYESDSGDSRC